MTKIIELYKKYPQSDRVLIVGIALILFYFLLLNGRLYLQTSPDETIKGLETNTLYVLTKTDVMCGGDVVLYKSAENKRSHYRPIAALEKSNLKLTKQGYIIDGIETKMPDRWVNLAKGRLDNSQELIIPENHVLIINTQFGSSKWKHNEWPYEVLEKKHIKGVTTHIFFSRDTSKIGTKINTHKNCQPL